MAKKSYQRHASGNEGELTYFCLITMTEKGRMRSKSATSGDRASTTKAVRDAGGKCRLYATTGSPYNYVSVMTNISPAAAISIAEQIERSGNRIVTMLPATACNGK